MLESIQTDELQYQKISPEEAEKRGILGRLVGVCADFMDPTRNGRRYSEELWENTFNDPIMKERIENGVCYGELGHPSGREETDMEKVAVALAEQPKKGKDGKLRAVFDILSTPNGKILKALCDYGSKLGISSRGSGDTFTDYDGQESVDPNTYQCQGFDVVLIPAVKEARLDYVTESLDANKRALTESLHKLVEDANDEDKKIMQDTIQSLDLSDLPAEISSPVDTPEDPSITKEPKELGKFKSKWHCDNCGTEVLSTQDPDSFSENDNEEDIHIVCPICKSNMNFINDTPEEVGNAEPDVDLIDDLQEALKGKRLAQQKVVQLQEKLSVCYAKETKNEAVITKLNNAVNNLTKQANKAKALETKVSKLDEQLVKTKQLVSSYKAANDKLSSSSTQLTENKKQLSESLNSKQKELTSLKESYESKLNGLNQDIANLQKDLQLKKTDYSTKLERASKLVEAYKKVANKAADKYIESEALKLGVNKEEIKNKLPESYTFDDIDKVCEDVQSFNLNISKLPFRSTSKLTENVKVKVNPSKSEPILSGVKSGADDEIDAQLLSLMK